MTKNELTRLDRLRARIDWKTAPGEGAHVVFVDRAPRVGADSVAIGTEGVVLSNRSDMFDPRYVGVQVRLPGGGDVFTRPDSIRVLREAE